MAERSAFWNGTVTGDATEAPYDANTEFAEWVQQTVGLGNTRPDAGVVLGTNAPTSQLGSLQVTVNSPVGMSVLLNIGTAIVHGTTYENDAAITMSIAANGSGSDRIDTIVLRKSWTNQTVRSAVLQGTPAGTPAPPSLTQSDGVTWEIPIADVYVFNGAVSITSNVITSRAAYVNAADGVYLDRILNSSGGTIVTGDNLRWNTARDVFTGGSTQAMAQAAGVQVGRLANGAIGRMLNRGIGYVLTSGAVTAGQFGHLGTTTKTVLASDAIRVNSFCRFLESAASSTFVLAFIDAGIHPQYGNLRHTTLSIAGAALAVTSIPVVQQVAGLETGTLVIEIMARSAAAAVSDVVNLRVGGAALDTTATNYFSYSNFIANSTPAVTAVQNLGATAGVQMAITGNNAPANVYTPIVIHIAFAYSRTLNKIMTGHGFMVTGTVNATLSNFQVGGRWINITEAIEQISLISNGGSNLMAGSYMNVYYKDIS